MWEYPSAKRLNSKEIRAFSMQMLDLENGKKLSFDVLHEQIE